VQISAESSPELRIPNAAAQTRMVSVAKIRLDRRKSTRLFKGIICDDISEFESHMPSQPVQSLWVRSSSQKFVRHSRGLAIGGSFSLGMIADYMDSLITYGAAFYRNLFWEAGLVGQVLYLEAEEASIRSTGIGCYFDDPVHEAFGISSRDWQSFYHFTVGGAVEDKRLTTLPAYKFEEKR